MTKLSRIVLAGLAIAGSLGWHYQSVNARACDDVRFVFARGSGESLGGPNETAWRTAIDEVMRSIGLKYSFYELGTRPHHGAQYGAVPVSGSMQGFGNLLGAYVSGGSAYDFGRSVGDGVGELRVYLDQQAVHCPNMKFVLGGYSQGAMVVMKASDVLDSDKLAYVATFGDPKLYLPEGRGRAAAACQGHNLSSYRQYVPDCHAYEGILGSRRPYLTASIEGKVGTWCNAKDIMCSSGYKLSDHTAYVSRGLYDHAARRIANQLLLQFGRPVSQAPTAHDLVLLIDLDSLQTGLAAAYQAQALNLANQVRSLGGRVALYSYSGSELAPVTEVCNFSCSSSELNTRLKLLAAQTSLGRTLGFGSTFSALKLSIQTLNWNVGANKSAVLLTQATRTPDYSARLSAELNRLSLTIDPVNIFALTDDPLDPALSALISETHGQTFSLSHPDFAPLLERAPLSFHSENYAGIVGDTIEFRLDVTRSASAHSQYAWDLDGDGIFELETATPTATRSYASPIDGFVQAKFTDAAGNLSTASAALKITPTAASLSTIQSFNYQAISDSSYDISFRTDAARVVLVIDDAIMGYFQITDGKVDFRLTDVSSGVAGRLISYSSDDIRGEAYDFRLSDAQGSWQNPATSLPSQPEDRDESSAGSNSPSSQPNPSQPTEPSNNQPSSSPSDQGFDFIPTVPNTGVRP